MNPECTTITFNDILRYPNHYITELVHYDKPTGSFLLYQYGPYLIMNNDVRCLRDHWSELKLTYKDKPIFRFMLDIGTLVKIQRGSLQI